MVMPHLVPTDFLNNFAVRVKEYPAFVPTMLVHTGLTAFFCQVGIKTASDREWCDTCNGPVAGPQNLAVLPLDRSEKLAAAVVDDDVELAGRLAYAGANAPLDGGCSIAHAHYCTTCDRTTAEVVEKTFSGLQSHVVRLTRRVPISAELSAALSSVPAVTDHDGGAADKTAAPNGFVREQT